jgi:hypothetical protein
LESGRNRFTGRNERVSSPLNPKVASKHEKTLFWPFYLFENTI